MEIFRDFEVKTRVASLAASTRLITKRQIFSSVVCIRIRRNVRVDTCWAGTLYGGSRPVCKGPSNEPSGLLGRPCGGSQWRVMPPPARCTSTRSTELA